MLLVHIVVWMQRAERREVFGLNPYCRKEL
jgi:hypothetical protein